MTVKDTWANLAGAFYFYPKGDCIATVQNSTFINTKTSFKYTSKGLGGVFYFDNENTDNMVAYFNFSTFINNSARLGGGIIYHDGIR